MVVGLGSLSLLREGPSRGHGCVPSRAWMCPLGLSQLAGKIEASIHVARQVRPHLPSVAVVHGQEAREQIRCSAGPICIPGVCAGVCEGLRLAVARNAAGGGSVERHGRQMDAGRCLCLMPRSSMHNAAACRTSVCRTSGGTAVR